MATCEECAFFFPIPERIWILSQAKGIAFNNSKIQKASSGCLNRYWKPVRPVNVTGKETEALFTLNHAFKY